jgi:hypothetical protein
MAAETTKLLQSVNANTHEYLFWLANEPSVGLHRVQENIRRNVPKIIDKKVRVHRWG